VLCPRRHTESKEEEGDGPAGPRCGGGWQVSDGATGACMCGGSDVEARPLTGGTVALYPGSNRSKPAKIHSNKIGMFLNKFKSIQTLTKTNKTF
jgi:hypothetical protein